KDPQTSGNFEVRINRHWLDFGAANQTVSGVVAYLDVLDRRADRRPPIPHALTIEEAQIIVIAYDGTESGVPHDLRCDIGIVGIEQRERLSCYVSDQGTMIVGQANLSRIFFRRFPIWRRPTDAPAGDDFHRHSSTHLEKHAR